ncbi:calcium-activated chloride channel protein (macronuclear) [Tetrahymena thermophila SB210]|uniref:Calcium-activated chloride channel protein n=1 Tax=Tetrahymena thermophila (strain SB210) TaxID=312017 RepID=I7LY64_TETTS|nr:calcium-activated chloride channel protein [Tetrahymena thermophila SB210]EAS07779.2 calcium-activated chloride channel protein [Tetrahymena thermophila SB210]|eukprot:XP_001028021.2 calcium-activated chloride channel protein [Tetrahymena thermophila SB210]
MADKNIVNDAVNQQTVIQPNEQPDVQNQQTFTTKKKDNKDKGYPPDYRRRRINKMKQIEKFLIEEEIYQHVDTSFQADVKYLDELDYHLGDFVFKLRNPDHPNFEYNKESQLQIQKLIDNSLQKKKPSQMKFSQLSKMADLILHADTPFETVRSENHLINLALFRVFKRIYDYVKLRDDPNQEEYNLLKEKYQEQNEKQFMIKYTLDNLGVFETIPKPPKDRKKNRQYKKANMIVDDEGYANTLKNDIKIPIANMAGEGKVDQRVPYLRKDQSGKWVRTDNPVSDFTTLFRNYLIYKLAVQGGFKLRQFISQSGEFFYIVLYTSFENLKAQASIMSLNKTFSLTQTDIFSLEPVDSRMRPLRLNHQLRLLTPQVKDGDPAKLQLVREEREQREKLKDDLVKGRYKKELEKQMLKYKGHRFISDEDYSKLIDISVKTIVLSEIQIDKYIDIKMEKNKLNVFYEDDRKILLQKQKVLGETITNERIKIKKQIVKDIENIPLLQHSAFARKYINNKGPSISKFSKQFFETKLKILELLFHIDFKLLQFECGSSQLQTKEEIQENNEESYNTYLGYLSYLEKLNELIQKVREKYRDKEEYEIDSYTLKQILDTKRPIELKSLLGRNKKKQKTYVVKKIKTTPNEQALEIHIPAANWKKYIYGNMQQEIYEAFTLALRRAQKGPNGRNIKTIWDYQGQSVQQIFSDYIYVPSSKRIRNKILLENCWQRQPINLNEKMEIFNKMERIKITTSLLVSLLDFSKLKTQEDLIYDYFPLHDKYLLFGQREHSDIFRRIIQEKIKQDYPNEEDYKFQIINSDKHYELQIKNYQMITDLCLLPNWNPLLIYNVPEQEICEYFGERIALYFTFQSFYFKAQFSVALLSTPIFIVYEYFGQTDKGLGAQIAGLIHIFIVVIWSNVFYGQWTYREAEFSLKYNQSQSGEDEEDIRPGFRGEYERSITSNKLNDYSYDRRLTEKSERNYWILIFFILIVNIVIIYALIYLQSYFDDHNTIDSGKTFMGLNIFIPTIILEFIFWVEEFLFKKFALFTCREANFKTTKEFEQSYSTKLFTFIFFNHLVPPTLISFIIDQNIGCVQDDCSYHLSVYIRSYQYIIVFKSIVEIIYPLLRSSLNNVTQLVKQLVNKDVDQKQQYLFDHVNIEIENQSGLMDSVIDEIDQPTRDYIEMFTYYCFNVTYGFGFPLVFAITFGITFIKMIVTRRLFTRRIKRPNPQNASTIGIFRQFMNLGSSLSILTYTGIFCFTRSQKPDWGPFTQLNAFMFISFFFFVVKFFIDRYYSELDSKTMDILKRQAFIRDNYNLKNNLSGPSTKVVESNPFFKVYGTYLEDKTEQLKKNN